MFEVQHSLSFIPPTTSESYLSHLMKANYNCPPINSVTVVLSLDIQMLTPQSMFTYID